MAAIAFDMYGTLADPASFATALDGCVDDPKHLAAAWRRQQLEISWLLSVMKRYESWPQVTRYGLEAALQENGIRLAHQQVEMVLEQTRYPALFDDVPEALTALTNAGHELAVFSNGTADELQTIVAETGIAAYFSRVITVDDVGVFKPAPAVYEHAAKEMRQSIGDVWLVSANPFDAAGAKAAGMRVAKLERTPTVRYDFAETPDLIVVSLRELVSALATVES